MEQQINIEDIMEEIREKVKNKKYSREALDFEFVMKAEAVKPFDANDFCVALQAIGCNMDLRYDEPIQGKGTFVKKIIKKLNKFYIKPLLEKQSRTNGDILTIMNQMGDYILQADKKMQEYELRIEYLEDKCNSLEK